MNETKQGSLFGDHAPPPPYRPRPKPEPTGAELAEEGCQRALDHANEEWKRVAADVLRLWIADPANVEVTSDDVRAEMIEKHPDVQTHELRAMGGIMKSAACAKLIEHYTPRRWVASRFSSRHNGTVEVWRIVR